MFLYLFFDNENEIKESLRGLASLLKILPPSRMNKKGVQEGRSPSSKTISPSPC